MALDWSILRTAEPVDIAGNFAQGYKIGSALVDKFHERNALATLANNPGDQSALATLYQVNPAMGAHFEERGQQVAQAQRRATLGAQYATDPQGAQTAAVSAGDFDLADHFGKLDEGVQKQAADFWSKAGPIAYQLKQIKDPAQRQAYWQQAKPVLASQTGDTALLERFDPTNDAQLDAAITTSQKMSEIISQNKPQEFNVEPGAARYERDPVTGAIRTIIAANPGTQPFGTPAVPGPVGVSPAAASVAATLSGAGLPASVVAGFMGNFHVEGGYDGAQGDGGSASGIAQWHNDRAATFQRVIGKPVTAASPAEQAQFVAWEMRNPEAAGMTVAQRDAILAAKTPAEAAALIDQHYERSSGRDRQVRMAAATAYSGDAVGAPVHAVSQSEFAALPSGAHFIALDDPTHTVRVKP